MLIAGGKWGGGVQPPPVCEALTFGPTHSFSGRTANIKAQSRLRPGDGQLHLEFPAL